MACQPLDHGQTTIPFPLPSKSSVDIYAWAKRSLVSVLLVLKLSSVFFPTCFIIISSIKTRNWNWKPFVRTAQEPVFSDYYLFGKGGYVFGGVGLSVCVPVDNITQNVMNGLGLNFMEGSWVVHGRTDKFWWWSGYSIISKWAQNIIIVVAHRDHGAGNDLKLFFFLFFFGGG